MKKFGLSVLFAFMMLALFATAASAEDSVQPSNDATGMDPALVGDPNYNANGTATGIDTNDGTTATSVKKNLTGHNTHTSYQNNTNSCASCHQTHTAKGDQLLFANGVYQTCSACHDGTLGYLNVFASGETAKTTGAGTFGGSHGASQHMANDAVNINAAPGGNPVADDGVKGTQWGESFNCASCHAPHGSYSDRLLSYNPNGIASMPEAQGGNQVKIPVVEDITTNVTADSPAKVLYRSTTADVVTIAEYNKVSTTSGDPAVTTYSYEKAHAPWLYGYDSRTDAATYWSRLAKDVLGDNPETPETETDFVTGEAVAAYGSTKGVYFSYEHAEVYSTTADGATALNSAGNGYIAKPVIVKMAKSGHNIIQSGYWSGATWTDTTFENTTAELKDMGFSVGTDNKVTGLGKAMSKFCAACHTDYLAHSADGAVAPKSHFETGTSAFRHSTDSDSYTCVRCHYGHGTDAYIMKDALGRTVADLTAVGGAYEGNTTGALGFIQDNNASSALKKFTNMSVCWACHNSSHAITLKNTDREADHPKGMPGTN